MIVIVQKPFSTEQSINAGELNLKGRSVETREER